MTLQPGTVLKGQYRIDALIGGGGMATVYRAFDLNLQRVCAIKQNLDTSPEAQKQFHVEAIVLANLSHPHLARVTDHFVDTTGQQYLVMDFVEGEDLDVYVRRTGAMAERQALAWMSGVFDALSYCHAKGVIHRDIKPANLVKRRGEDTVVLVDFGIAKQQAGGMTLAGARAASPAFAPPEQFSGHTDPRSDVYALAGTLYYLLTEQTPPDARLVMAGVQALTPPQALNPRISPATDQAIMRGLSVRMSDRPATVAEFARLLQVPAQGSSQRSRLGWVAAALALLALLALSALTLPRLLGPDGGAATPPGPVSTVVAVTPAATPTVESTPEAAASPTPVDTPTPMAISPEPAASTGSVSTTTAPVATVAARPDTATPAASATSDVRNATSTPVPPDATATFTATPRPTATPAAPAATATAAVATPTRPPQPVAATTPCPPYLHRPLTGMGLLLIENHLGEPLHIDNIATGEKWDLPPKQGDVPARLVLDLPPGSHTFVDNTSRGYGRIGVVITAGSAFISPIWYNDRSEELVYPLDIPNGCK